MTQLRQKTKLSQVENRVCIQVKAAGKLCKAITEKRLKIKAKERIWEKNTSALRKANDLCCLLQKNKGRKTTHEI